MRPDNGNINNTPQVTEAELRRRQQLIRLGLLVCFGLALMDTGPITPDINETSSSHSSKTQPASDGTRNNQISILNRLINAQEHTSMMGFPQVNGIYRGKWRRSSSNYQRNSSVTQAHIIPEIGKFTLQLRTSPIAHVHNLTFVYGILQAEGLLPKSFPSQNVLFPMQGVYSKVDGSLTLLATPSRSHKLFFGLPIIPTVSDQANLSRQISLSSRHNLMNDSNFTGTESNHSYNVSSQELGSQSQLSSEVNDTIQQRFLRSVSQPEITRIATPYFLPNDPKIRRNITNRIAPFSSFTAPLGSSGVGLMALPVTALTDRALLLYDLEHGLGDMVLSDQFRAYQNNPLVPTASDKNEAAHDKKVLGEKKNFPKQMLLLHCLISTELWTEPLNKPLTELQRAMNIRGTITSQSQLDFEPSSSCSLLSNIDISLELFDIDGKLKRKTSRYCFIEGLVCIIQIYLLITQLRHVQTQAAAAKLSIIGILGQALLDSLQCVLSLLLSNLFNGEYFYYFIPIAVFKLIMFGIFEMRMVILVYQSRYAQELGAGWNTLRQYLALLHIRFYGSLFAAMIFIFSFQNWPVLVVLVLYSFWVPQVILNAVAGIKKPFAPTYAVTMSLCRLFFPLYLLGCPANIFAAIEGRDAGALSPLACIGVTIWMACQVVLLHLQDTLGPRFFVPGWMLPVSYNYERPLPTHMMPVDGPEGGELPECVICYTGVDPWMRNYMITPCDHVFHRDCLSEWLNHKLECPVCRASLPSAESS